MDPETITGGEQREFPPTRWSEILALRDTSSPEYRERLDRLLRTYWKPVYAYIRTGWGKTVEEAKDLTQAFFTRMLEKKYLSNLKPGVGSFRGYLKCALKTFLINEHERQLARRPRDGKPLVSLDATPEELERLGPQSKDETPEQVYDREWFCCVLRDSIRMLELQLKADGKEVYFEVFRRYRLEPQSDAERPTHQQVAKELGISPADVHNYLTYCKNVLRRIARSRVREYVETDVEAEEEFRKVLGR